MSYPALSRECLSSCWAEWSCVIQTSPLTGSGGGWDCAEGLRGFIKAACGGQKVEVNCEMLGWVPTKSICVVLCFFFCNAASSVEQQV